MSDRTDPPPTPADLDRAAAVERTGCCTVGAARLAGLKLG